MYGHLRLRTPLTILVVSGVFLLLIILAIAHQGQQVAAYCNRHYGPFAQSSGDGERGRGDFAVKGRLVGLDTA